MEIQIRKAEEYDLPQILNLYAQPDMDNGEVLPLDSARELFNKLKKYPEYTIFVATSKGETVGTFSLLIMDNLVHGGAPSGIVEAVVVTSKYRGIGIGKKMMGFVSPDIS